MYFLNSIGILHNQISDYIPYFLNLCLHFYSGINTNYVKVRIYSKQILLSHLWSPNKLSKLYKEPYPNLNAIYHIFRDYIIN